MSQFTLADKHEGLSANILVSISAESHRTIRQDTAGDKASSNSVYLLSFALFPRFFLSQGALVDQIGGDLLASPLHWATRSGHLESVILLIRAGANPLLRDKEGLNCVMVATAFEHTQCLAYILAKLG